METNNNMEASPLTQELYAIDWAVRFDEFRSYDQTSYTDLHQMLAKIEGMVETNVASDSGDLSDTKVLTAKFNKSKPRSLEWHYLSMLVNLKIILAAIPKGLTATATLSAIQIMEHMWKIVELTTQTKVGTAAAQTNAEPAPRKIAAAKKAPPAPAPRKRAKPTKAAASKAAPKPAAKKPQEQTENVVIKQLATEARLNDDEILEARCYEVASSLANEYPEYTLTAIRVMTAEKLGVTRQFVENLDIKPARFKNAR